VNVTVERTRRGEWRVSAIVGGYLVTRTYLYYTRRESVARFRAEMKGGEA